MQQSMFNLVDGGLPLVSQVLEARPDQQGAGDMITLDARFATLARLDSRQLLDFAVILLDLPAKGARLLCAFRRILSQIVGHDPFRAARRHHNPKEFHLVVAGKAANLDQLAPFQFDLAPFQFGNMAIRPLPAAVINHAVALERAIENLVAAAAAAAVAVAAAVVAAAVAVAVAVAVAAVAVAAAAAAAAAAAVAAAAAAGIAVNGEHQVFGGIPGIHQDGAKRNGACAKRLKHLSNMIELGFAIVVGIIKPVVKNPEATAAGMNVEARNQADAVDDTVFIAAPLSSRQFDAGTKLLIQNAVVKDNVSRFIELHHLARVFPQQTRRQLIAAQIAVRVPFGRMSWLQL